MPRGKPHKTKCINVPQEASSITGNQQNVPSDYFKYLLYSVFLFKVVLLMSYLKKLIQKKSKRESQALKKSTLEIHWSWKHQLNRMAKETCRLVDRFKLLMQISILARLHAFKLETSFDVSFLEICDWISFILKTQDFQKKKSTEEKYKSYQWGCCPEFLDRRCQSTGNSQRYHYPKQQQLLGCFRSFLRFLRVLHHHLVFPTSNLVLWQLYNRRIPFKFWKYWKSGRKSRRKSSVIFLPSGHNIVHVLFICTQCSLVQPRLNVSRRKMKISPLIIWVSCWVLCSAN